MEDFVLKLGTPVQQGEETISELRFKPVTAKHLRSLPLQNQKLGDLLDVAQAASDQPPSVFDKLSFEDFQKVIEYVGKFAPNSQETGEE